MRVELLIGCELQGQFESFEPTRYRPYRPSIFLHSAITWRASLITQCTFPCGSQYSPAKPPAGLAEDALPEDVVAAGAEDTPRRTPRRSRAHQPIAMPLNRLTAIGQSDTAAHARRHGHTQPARNIGVLTPTGMAPAHSLGSSNPALELISR